MQKFLLSLVLLLGSLSNGFAEDLQKVIDYYQPSMTNGFIYISKLDMTLTLVDAHGQVVVAYPMACGKSRGPKQKKGDMRTPEGKFSLQQMQEADTWNHDFGDGKGVIKGAYGPFFLRLKTGFQGIGIHGTHDPASIGTRATEGCIRLENKNVAALQKQVTLGMPVIIGPEAGVASLKEKPAVQEKLVAVKEVSKKEDSVAKETAAKEKIASAKEKPIKEKPVKEKPSKKTIKTVKEHVQPAWSWPPRDSQAKE